MKKNIRRNISLTLVLMMLISLLAGCSSNEAPPAGNNSEPGQAGEATEIVIGALYPLTGPNAKTGKEFIDALELAIDIVNSKHDDLGEFPFAGTEGIPNMNGAKIRLVKADTQGNPEVGATEAERLITSQNVDMLVGCYQSAVTKTASTVAERLQVPFVNASSTANSLTQSGFEWFFRTGPTDGTFVDDTVKFMNDNKAKVGIEKVAIVAEDTEFGMNFAAELKTKVEDAGYTIVENISYPANTPNVSSEIIRIKNAAPDVIIQLSYISDAILFMKSYKDMDVNPKMIIGQRAGFTVPEFQTSLGGDAEYVMSTSAFSLDLQEKRPFLKTINEKFNAITGTNLNTEYARAMQKVFIVADAYNRAGTTEKAAVQAALRETALSDEWLLTPYAGVEFNQNGQNVKASGVMIQIIDGEYKTIAPENYAVVEPVIPVPAWKER